MPDTTLTQGNFLSHVPCDKCGSSDANSLYDDGHMYCFGCNTHVKSSTSTTPTPKPPKRELGLIECERATEPLKSRGISVATLNKWGYTTSFHGGRKCHVATYKDHNGTAVCQKLRFADKSFSVVGNTKDMPLYGMWLWNGGRKLVITEGEIDALSVSQAQDNKWPVVSVPNGAQGAVKSIQRHLEWVEGFDEVIIMFDMDEPGQEAAVKVAELLSPGKAKIASLPAKDPNELLKAGRQEEIIRSMWNAKVYRPDGIVCGSDLLDVLLQPLPPSDANYPWPLMDDPTRGMRCGELILVGAGSGCGKSTFVDEITYSLIMQGKTLGYIGLETSVQKAMLGICGLHLNKRVKIDGWADEEALKETWKTTVGNGNVYFYDHFGSVESTNLMQKIRYLVRGCGCQWIIFDHISISVSGMEDGDERRRLDSLMTSLRSLCEEANCGIIVISHLRRPSQGLDWSQGRRPSESDFRGSGSLYQLSDLVIGLSRDSTNEEPHKRNIVGLHVLKNRWVGDQGHIGDLSFDPTTGRLNPSTDTESPFNIPNSSDESEY